MTEYRSFDVRKVLTCGHWLPGISYFLTSFALTIYSMISMDLEPLQDSNLRCDVTRPTMFVLPYELHLTINSLLGWVMLGTFAVVFVWKIGSLLSFAICPLKKYAIEVAIYGGDKRNPS